MLILIIIFFILIIIAFFVLYSNKFEANNIKIERISIKSDKILYPMLIMQVSDFHLYHRMSKKRVNNIIDTIHDS